MFRDLQKIWFLSSAVEPCVNALLVYFEGLTHVVLEVAHDQVTVRKAIEEAYTDGDDASRADLFEEVARSGLPESDDTPSMELSDWVSEFFFTLMRDIEVDDLEFDADARESGIRFWWDPRADGDTVAIIAYVDDSGVSHLDLCFTRARARARLAQLGEIIDAEGRATIFHSIASGDLPEEESEHADVHLYGSSAAILTQYAIHYVRDETDDVEQGEVSEEGDESLGSFH